jgi:DNA-binding transcriptional ArsR family regulator
MVTIKSRREDAVFRAIADPTRREILSLLRGGGRTVGAIAANFRTSRPAISKHLRQLRSAGLVVSRKHGAARMCGLNAKPLRAVNQWLQDYEAFWGESLQSLKSYIEQSEPLSTKGNHEPGKRKRHDSPGNHDQREG